MNEDPHLVIDWEQSNATLNFYCGCGANAQFDSKGAHLIECKECGGIWRIPSTVTVYRYVHVELDRPHIYREPVKRPATSPDCLCCSCREIHPGPDPYCRAHGFAGTRSCELHGSPGIMDETGRLPRTIEQANGDHSV